MKAKLRNGQNWQARHNAAIAPFDGGPNDHERAYLRMLQGWSNYAQVHQAEFDSSIGDDGVLGPAWEAVGDSLRELLNGEVGPRLDCGTLDSFILDTMKQHDVDTEEK